MPLAVLPLQLTQLLSCALDMFEQAMIRMPDNRVVKCFIFKIVYEAWGQPAHPLESGWLKPSFGRMNSVLLFNELVLQKR